MLSLYQPQYGGPSVLELVERPKPAPGPGEVLVRVHAAAINDWDWIRLTGKPAAYRGFSTNRKLPGCDFAGTVEAIGPGAGRFAVGDAVMGDLSVVRRGGVGPFKVARRWGAFAEYVVASEKILAVKHPGLSFEDAACLPQSGILALQCIRDALDVQSGQSLLINGAGGGAGALAIQMAKQRGARVTVCDRADKLARLLALGADEAIAWPEPGCYGHGRRWDRILDVAICLPMAAYVQALTPGGVIAAIGWTPGAMLGYYTKGTRLARRNGASFVFVWQNTTVQDLELLMRMAATSEAKPVVDSVFTLDQASEAFERFGSGKHQGKVVFRVAG